MCVRLFCPVIIAVATVAASAGTGWAQAPSPRPLGAAPGPPTLNPYLNLLRGGASPGVNYQGLVRPQMYFNGAIQNLQTQLSASANPLAPAEGENTGLPGTGIPVQFMNHHAYFMNLGTGMSAGGLPGRPGGSGGLPGRPGRMGQSAGQPVGTAATAAVPLGRTR